MEKLKKFVDGKHFQGFILFVILLNAVVLGLQTSKTVSATAGGVLSVIDSICLGIFIFEMLLKMIAYKFIGYFKNGWNWFDFIIILMSVLSGVAVFSSFRVLRVFRVFRSLKGLRGFKMVSSLKPMQVIIGAIGKSLPGISWTALLLIVIYYIYSIIGVTCFGETFQDWFGTIPAAMYTLFQVMTLESWSMGISRPVMEVFGSAWIYFVSFVLISSFVMMNVVVGIVVNAISEVAEMNRKDEAEEAGTAGIKEEMDAVKEHLAKLEELLDKHSQK
ncbi:MAG: ion transporter [Lachnospiraceae bacterium]|nr:ion transporter [Lachnospiraceae bacterium]